MVKEKKDWQESLKLAKEALEKIDKEKYPKRYAIQEQLVDTLQYNENMRIRAEKAEKEAKKAKETASPPKKKGEGKTPKKQGFDYGELAYLTAKGISEDCHEFLLNEVKTTGKELKELLGFNYVKEEMNKITEAKAAQDAIPTASKRSSKVTKDNVDYWLAKGELPENTPENQQLRRDIVNARAKREVDKSKFTDNPVIGG